MERVNPAITRVRVEPFGANINRRRLQNLAHRIRRQIAILREKSAIVPETNGVDAEVPLNSA